MEVDNLCNLLVNDLHAVGSQPDDPDLSDLSDGTVLKAGDPPGKEQGELVEGERMEGVVDEGEVTLTDLGREEMDNLLNDGKEALSVQPASLLSSSPPSDAVQQTPTTSSNSAGVSSVSTDVSTDASTSVLPSHSEVSHETRPSPSEIPHIHGQVGHGEEKRALCDPTGIAKQGDITASRSESHSGTVSTQAAEGEIGKVTPEASAGITQSVTAASPEPGCQSARRDTAEGDLDSHASDISSQGSSTVSSLQPACPPTCREATEEPANKRTSHESPITNQEDAAVSSSQSCDQPARPQPAEEQTDIVTRTHLSDRLTSPATVSESSSTRSAVPPAPHKGSKSPPIPIPRTRTSLHKSDHVAPPAEEVVEIARPSVKKRMSLSRKGEGKEEGEVKEMVAEQQPDAKKSVPTVHASRMLNPPRLVTEQLEPNHGDCSHGNISSTDLDHSGMSSQEDDVFSDESLRRLHGRDRSYSSGMGVGVGASLLSPRQPPSPSSLTQHGEMYQHLTASRSSLDDSVLQLAAERHDDLMAHWDSTGSGAYTTGSLRVRRSQKMRHLMEVFERGSSEDSSGAKVSDTGSSKVTQGSHDKEVDDGIFQPLDPSSVLGSVSRRSRPRERGGGGGSLSSPHRPSHTPPTSGPLASSGEDSGRRRLHPSPAKVKDPPAVTSRSASGQPHQQRRSSRGRACSDSAALKSDSRQTSESSAGSVLRWSGGSLGQRKEARKSGAGLTPTGHTGEEKPDRSGKVKRRESIKELRQLFENMPKDDSKDSGSELSPPTPLRRSSRPRSVSPAADSGAPCGMANIMRYSLEIPSTSSILKQRDTHLTSQPLRLGPKPFYGSKQ